MNCIFLKNILLYRLEKICLIIINIRKFFYLIKCSNILCIVYNNMFKFISIDKF